MEKSTQLSARQVFLDKIRIFNRKALNPFTLSFAGRRHSPYAIVGHVGRKSGKAYATPVVAMAVGEHFVIPMPYGAHVDWCRNVQAAKQSILAWNGDAYQIGEPRVIEPLEGLPAFPQWLQIVLEKSKTEKYLRVKRLSKAGEQQAAYQELIAHYPAERAVRVIAVATAIGVACVVLISYLSRKKRAGS